MKVPPESQAARLLWTLYPRHDAFVRRRQFSYSAEVVEVGQVRPPYRTIVVAEASTPEALIALLERHQP